MKEARGYILKIKEERREIFEHSNYSFAEPVNIFSYSKNLPLIVFVVNEQDEITHISKGSAGNIAGTGLRKLKLIEITKIKKPIKFGRIKKHTSNRTILHLARFFEHGGLLPPATFKELVTVLLELDINLSLFLVSFKEERYNVIRNIPERTKQLLAEQKEAINTALHFADIDRKSLLEWTPKSSKSIKSFMDGLPSIRLREDEMIQQDFDTFPEFNLLKPLVLGRRKFSDSNTDLEIIMASRLELEKQMGVDLIYYNLTYDSFIMIQYKAMEQNSDSKPFYKLPNDQLSKEIERMKKVISEIGPYLPESRNEFRFISNPFFFKLCPRIVLNPDSVDLTPGMYFPLDHWHFLEKDPDILNPNGVRKLTQDNVGRHICNTDFANFLKNAWIGTIPKQSQIIKTLIEKIVRTDHTLVLALKSDKGISSNDLKDETLGYQNNKTYIHSNNSDYDEPPF
jgi:hypothetical protein